MSDIFTPRHSFPQFLHLPTEIRLMIWEETWPGPRIIEVEEHLVQEPDVLGEIEDCRDQEDIEDLWGPDESEGSETPETWEYCLQLRCTFSSFLGYGHCGTRGCWKFPFKAGLLPVALQVCRESRTHTLGTFVCLRHSSFDDKRSFYFNPKRDILWLSNTIIDDANFRDDGPELAELRAHYGGQLDGIENVLVEEPDWEADGPLRYCSRFLGIFKGIRAVQILLDDAEFRCPRLAPAGPEYYADLANELKESDMTDLKDMNLNWTIQYIDRYRRTYCQFNN